MLDHLWMVLHQYLHHQLLLHPQAEVVVAHITIQELVITVVQVVVVALVILVDLVTLHQYHPHKVMMVVTDSQVLDKAPAVAAVLVELALLEQPTLVVLVVLVFNFLQHSKIHSLL